MTESTIEKCARAIIEAGYNPATARDIAQVELTTLAEELDEGALKKAQTAYCSATGDDDDWHKHIAVTVKAYLNAIKEGR